MWGLSRLAAMAAVSALGWLIAEQAGVTLLPHSTIYVLLATTLLVIGLYSSTAGIDLADLRGSVRTVVLAVTVGVLAKALIISGILYLIFREPWFLILGVAVAQIDPLAVAAVHKQPGMSQQARSLLAAWASFDDPITVILAVYGTAWVLHRNAGSGAIGSSGSVVLGLLANAALAAAVFGIWLLLRRLRQSATRPDPGWRTPAQVLLLLAAGAAAVYYSLALAIAAVGLFLRPRIERTLAATTQAAFLAATFLVGFALAGGVYFRAGLVLGACAFGAQVVVGALIPASLTRTDRIYLAFAQQNGITAIILALLLEPQFPGTIGIVAPAIVTVAVLHAVTNGLLSARLQRDPPGPPPVRPAPRPGPGGPTLRPPDRAKTSPRRLRGRAR